MQQPAYRRQDTYGGIMLSAAQRAFFTAEVEQIAADSVRAGWSSHSAASDRIVHGEASTISDWARLRTSSVYSYPGRLPSEPWEPPVSGVEFLLFSPFLILGGTMFWGSMSGELGEDRATEILLIVGLMYIVAGIMASALQRHYENRLSDYWERYDPHQKQRNTLESSLKSDVRRALEIAAQEYSRPLATIEPEKIPEMARRPLGYSPQDSRPQKMLSCTPRQAEYLARDWMAWLGATGADVSQATRDGGADVVADHFIAEVKHRAVPSSPDLVRQIFGVATVEEKKALFFSLSGYTADAVQFADRAGVALFVYHFGNGTLAAKSRAARIAIRDGLGALVERAP